jgi:hypothetical protein
MKKLLLLLILSFFSTTGYSGTSYPPADSGDSDPEPAAESPASTRTCPDGNEPTKGLSADGYYFVYTCGSVEPVPIVSPEAKVSSETTSNKSTPEDLGEDDYIAKIKEAKALLDSGIISEEQFEKMKQKIIDSI